MSPAQIAHHRPDVTACLSDAALAEDIAVLLRRWREPGRPAVLVVLDWDVPFADVYPEEELRREFPDAPLVHAGSNDEDGGARVLVYVIDEHGEAAYAIPDPRAWG